MRIALALEPPAVGSSAEPDGAWIPRRRLLITSGHETLLPMLSARFDSTFGAPAAGTGVALADLELAHSEALAEWTAGGAAGVYASGLLSVCSVRENGGDPGPWGRYLPGRARIFASGAFGLLYVTTGEDLWIVSPQYGQVIESDVTLDELPDLLCEPDVLDEFLRQELFELWSELHDEMLDKAWLCPSPAPALGGTWTLAGLQPMRPDVFLSFTAQLFADGGSSGVEVRRLPPA